MEEQEEKAAKETPSLQRADTFCANVSTDVLEDLSEDTTEHLLLEPGNVLKLRCDMSSRPGMAVNWYKEGVRILPTPRIQIRGTIMEITDVTYEDSGVYVCVLRGTKGPVRNFTITVAGKETNTLNFFFSLRWWLSLADS